jgi:hypothetical protein
MIDTEVDERGFTIESIPDNPIEYTPIGLDDPFEESFRRDHLALPWLDHLHV